MGVSGVEGTTPKKRIWWSETEFYGATGVNSVREFAELMMTSAEVKDILIDVCDDPENIEDVIGWLESERIHADILSVREFQKEQWDMSKVFPCAFDAKPGRGYIKVIGVNA